MIALTFVLKMWRCMNYEEKKLSSANVSTSKTHMPLVRLSEMLENRDCGTVILLHHQVGAGSRKIRVKLSSREQVSWIFYIF